MNHYEALRYFDQSEMVDYLDESNKIEEHLIENSSSTKNNTIAALSFAILIGSLSLLHLIGINYFKNVFNFEDLLS